MGFLLWLTQFLSLILFHFHFHTTFSSSFSSTPLCAHDQSLALLQFKRSFSINTDLQMTRYSNYLEMCQDHYPKTESWKEATDCCLWDGVTCDMKTGQVIGLDLSCSMLYGTLHSNNTLFSLYHLQKIDLSGNDFNSSHISSQFGHLSNLTHLSLNYSGFAGQVPPQFSLLSKLVSLHLSFNEKLALEPIVFDKLVQNLTELRELHLNWVNMSLVVPSSLTNLSSSLSSLQLGDCRLQGKLPDNVLQRPSLQLLYLWGNINLTGSFPPFNVSVASSSLDLSGTGISIDLEHDSINNLKSVKNLYLSECHFVGSNLAPLGNLTQLTELDLSFNRISGHIPFSLGKLKHLQYLNLGYNNFTGPIPYDFEQLTELASLHLSRNTYLTLDSSSFNKLVQNLTELRDLSLDSVNMSLVEPNSLTNLSSSLSSLYLSSSGLRGKFPSNIFLLPNIESLYLSGNEGLTGSFPSSNVSSALKGLGLSDTRISVDLENDFIRNLKSLEYLYLRNCTITKRSNLAMLGNLTQLTELHLSHNHFSGHIPSSFGNLVKLGWLDLSSNNFTGQIPSSFGNLVKLWWLDLSSNNFTGQISDFLGNLTQLEYLLLSDNQFLGPIPSEKSSFANLLYLHLSDNLLNGTIPPFLFSHPSLRNLDLRNNLFTGNLSEFQCNSFEWLDLSNNHLHGPIPNSIFNQEYLTVLNLASNNKLTGEISSSVCKLASLQALDLSNNSLSGFIPQCLWNFTNSLSVLHLGMNNLQGTVPAKFSIGNSLGYLNLNGNELEGKIPTSIVNCTKLEVLDLGNNKIEDKFPYFLERLQELQVLVLKSNKLYGFVKGPTTNNSFSKLRIFDISNNNLSGELPKGYFNDFEAMMSFNQNMIYMSSRNVSYDYSIRMTWKGLEMEFVKIRNTLTSIDLSDNNFTGEIPESIGKLKALGQLNLSHNSFTGYIQPSLGNLTNLESLDLSSNLLTGRIPMQLADLTFLSALNLSHNQLQGPIPKGKQFNTFNNDSFEGNLGLCGFPISKECNSGETQLLPPSTSEEGDDSILFRDGFGWKAVAMGYGCGFVFGVTMGYIMFRTRKPTWFVKVVEGQWNLTVRRRKKNVHGNGVRRN